MPHRGHHPGELPLTAVHIDKDGATAGAWFGLLDDEPTVLADEGEQL